MLYIRRKAEQHSINEADHDDFIEAVFAADEQVILDIIPSAKRLSPEVRQLVTAFKKQGVHSDIIDFCRLAQYCDVAAAQSHASIHGTRILTQSTYADYEAVNRMLCRSAETGSAIEGFKEGYHWRAEVMQCFSAEDPFQQVLLRICSLLRLSTSDDGQHLLTAANDLEDSDRQLLTATLGIEGRINSSIRTPTYLPAIATNLITLTMKKGEPRAKQIDVALRGFVSACRVLNNDPDLIHRAESEPVSISFQRLAAAASEEENSSFFTLNDFDVSRISFDKQAFVLTKKAPVADYGFQRS